MNTETSEVIGRPQRSLSYCPPGTKQVVLGFFPSRMASQAMDRCEMMQTIYKPFLPLGLFVHGSTEETYLCGVHCGNQSQQWSEVIPASFFATSKSFDDLKRLSELGEIAPLPRQLFEMDVLEVGNSLRVAMLGPFSGVTVWGLTYLSGGPHESLIVAKEGAGYVGRVIRHGLRGDEVSLQASAPSEESVCRLLEGRRGRVF